jgi:tRNA 2-thiouridine synthesizing protein A
MSLVATTVDARGQSCPGPIVSLFQAMKGAGPGEAFELLATDPGSKTDVPSWATISGNELLEAEDRGTEFRYVVRKGAR